MPTELLIQGGHVVTVDPSLGDFVDGDVLVSDGVIAEVGHHLVASVPEAEVIDARGRLVIPGLVDTHRHVWQGAIGGFTPQMTGAGYEVAVLRGIAPRHTPNDIYAGTLWGALQALDAGITTIGDWAHNLQSAEHADADLRGLQDSGIRGYFLYGGPGPASDDPDPPHPLDARRMRDEQFSAGTNGRLRMGMALRGPCFTSAERNAADFAFARELGLRISLHVGMAGTADAIMTLERFGLLGADVNYAHGNMLTDDEFNLIAASRGTLSITPSTDMLMQFGTYPGTGRALGRGVVSGLGVDTICSAGTDLFSEMRLALAAERSRANAAALARGERVEVVDLHQRDMLRLATLDGARVWALDDEIWSYRRENLPFRPRGVAARLTVRVALQARCPDGSGRAHAGVQVVHLEAGGLVGKHKAPASQLFAVVAGSGWVSGREGRRRDLAPGYAALWDQGEAHEAGTDGGMTAVCVEGDFEVRAVAVTKDIVVSDYNPDWPRWFEEVRDYVWPAVLGVAIGFDHVGSTAVPGLAAKPIVDIDIVVAAEDYVGPVIERLGGIGYRWEGDLGVSGREAFSRPSHVELPPHHLYLVVKDNRAHLDHWLFRDLLRADPNAREAYSALKRHNVEQAQGDIDVYIARKAGFVAGLLKRAREERGVAASDLLGPARLTLG